MKITKEVYEVLYSDLATMVRSVLCEYEHNYDKIDDLAQDVWMRVWEKRSQFNGLCAASTWVYSIAQNVGANYVRDKVKRSPTTLLASEIDNPDVESEETVFDVVALDYANTPEYHAMKEQTIKHAFGKLARLESIVWTLVYWKGFSYDATAKYLGIQASTVGPIVARIRRKFSLDRIWYGEKVHLYRPTNGFADWSWKKQHASPGPCTKRPDLVALYN